MKQFLTKTYMGHDIRVGLFGKKDAARDILFFNGIGARLDAVEEFSAFLPDCRIVTFDAPGVGDSPAPWFPYRPSMLSKMAALLLDDLGIEKADVFGVSWGGAIAQQFAKDHQSRCHTLTLAATSPGMIMVPGNISAIMKMVTPKRYFDPDHMMKIAPSIYGGRISDNLAMLEEYAKMVMGGSTRGYVYQLLAGYGWTSWFWLPQIKTPTLVLMGDHDNIVPPSNGRMLASRLPNCELQFLDCGHLFLMTMPQQTANRMLEFFEKH